ncbi:gamma-glutamyltransferase [Aliidiomarina halalkaliphila]|uniref:Glutathione hydrolase proenzyme n=1 Tax=Aliidiomarina halalkaliphila TaxID=2593535 RepID=A0A552X3Q3_9GAMM|nr:gamma-glutamyltransferase [Aliidiomarina halalkaliphila]TRW49670.1 gamma-glutamyltransferase [Aliidiomarina halalkaliphila]
MQQFWPLVKGKRLIIIAVSVFAVSVTACSPVTQQREAYEPEAATGWEQRTATTASKYMVAAANPHAVEAGLAVLREGGTAIDAAVAVQAMLTLVEPQSSGIGGGAFLLYWDNSTQQLHSLDARETAPMAATPELFLDENGNAPRWIDAVVGGRSVGTPSVMRGLEAAHQRWGQLDWSRLFDESIELAESGFEVSPRLSQLIELEFNPGLARMPVAREYFFPNGTALQPGQRRDNPELADTFRALAAQGADALHQGPIAEDIVQAVQNSPIAPGLLSMEDLAAYQPVWREPVCGGYRVYRICSMGPPSSGGITLLQSMALLEPFSLHELPVNGEQALHYFTQASRLAFADRNRYIADEDYVEVPLTALLDRDYLATRTQLIGERDMGLAQPGDLEGFLRSDDQSLELPSTSHISIVDQYGNAVSMTTTIEMGFGSTVMTRGFLLNNQLTDFSLVPEVDGMPVANRVEPGKRPRSSMSPVIVFEDESNALLHVIGSPGGPRIINYVTQTLIGVLDWDLDIQQAMDLPRITNMNGVTSIEEGTAMEALKAALEARGHQVEMRGLNSGLHGISVTPDGFVGGADPRREGRAQGDD